MISLGSGAQLIKADVKRKPLDVKAHVIVDDFPLSTENWDTAWQSNGGYTRNHPARVMPFQTEFKAPVGTSLERFILIGVFALYCDAEKEAPGTLGATVQFFSGKELIHRVELVNGRHYTDSLDLAYEFESTGDGCEFGRLGSVEMEGQTHRLDCLLIDVPFGSTFTHVIFKDLGSPASFVILEAAYQARPSNRCPFHSQGGGVPLSEVGAIIRVRDRVRFQTATSQFEQSLLKTKDLDEARGEALTFLAVITAGLLEAGGSRSLHRVQLEAARQFEKANDHQELINMCRQHIGQISGDMSEETEDPSAKLMDRALVLIERNFATDLTDEQLAAQLGLSTSHFRFLFKQSTNQPFHRYLVSLRLEKARALLELGTMSVSEVGKAVGFHGLAHFSRVFTQRFSISPNDFRRTRR